MNPGRGFFGIGVYHPKAEVNIGTLWRHAWLYDASFIFTIGRRYRHQPGDTARTPTKIPLYNYLTYEEMRAALPYSCQVVCVELCEGAKPLHAANHPERCVYLLGAEDHGLPEGVLRGNQKIVIPTPVPRSMNVAVAGTLVMNDRYTKALAADRRPLVAV